MVLINAKEKILKRKVSQFSTSECSEIKKAQCYIKIISLTLKTIAMLQRRMMTAMLMSTDDTVQKKEGCSDTLFSFSSRETLDETTIMLVLSSLQQSKEHNVSQTHAAVNETKQLIRQQVD